jgi:hypothetical protein
MITSCRVVPQQFQVWVTPDEHHRVLRNLRIN